MIATNLNMAKAIEFLLTEKYLSEFEVIDRLNQHPKGYNFYDWLASKGIITEYERDVINEQIAKEEEEG